MLYTSYRNISYAKYIRESGVFFMLEHVDNVHEVMDVMKLARDALRARFLKLTTPYKLTVAQFKALQHVHWHDREEGIGICELSKHLGLANSTTSGIVDRLEREGWVKRDRSNLDRRTVGVKLTKKGRDLFERAPRDVEEFWTVTIGRLSIRDQEELLAGLRKLRQVMEEPEWPSYEEIHADQNGAPQGEHTKTRANLEEILSDELRDVGQFLVLARRAQEQGQLEVAAYLRQIAEEETDHAFGTAKLLRRVTDLRKRLTRLIEAKAKSKGIKTRAAEIAEKERWPEAGAFFRDAAEVEGRHARALESAREMLEAKG